MSVGLWDPLPAEAHYISGSITSAVAPPVAYNATVRAIIWQGTLPTATSRAIRFQVSTTRGQPLSPTLPIVNTAWLTDTESGEGVSAMIMVNARRVYLPLALRQSP